MSYDLYFYTRADLAPVKKGLLGPLKAVVFEGIDEGELLYMLKAHGQFPDIREAQDGFDARYLNKDTGTAIEFSLHKAGIEYFERKHPFFDYKYTGLKASLDFLRPQYFGHEAALLIETLCREYNFFLYEPVHDRKPKPCVRGEIVRSWERANRKAIQADYAKAKADQEKAAARGKPAKTVDPGTYLARDKSLTWWKYMYHKEDLSRKIRENPAGIYVPEWKIVRKVGGKKLLRAITLAEGMGYVMPECDVYLVKRNSFSETGVVPASVLKPRIAPYLKPWNFSGLDLSILTSPDANRIAAILRDVEMDPIGDYEQVRPGAFIDVDPARG